jgi:hypothetical protein
MQPLVGGATATNPYNGIGDPEIISPFFLDDLCRCVMRWTGLDVISFMWLWRLLFPLFLALSFLILAAVCLPREEFPWSRQLRFAAAAASFCLVYCLYDLATYFPPLQGHIQRVPTNIEYPLSVLMAASSIAFADRPGIKRGVALGLVSAILVYLRLYAAIPWAMAVIAIVVGLLVMRRAKISAALAAAGTVLLGVAPWLYITIHNSSHSDYREMIKRFYPPFKYEVHHRWWVMLAAAGILLAAGILFTKKHRVFVFCSAGTIFALPFISGLLPIAQEVLLYDRYGVFYLVVLVAVAMLVLSERSRTWQGPASAASARRAVIALSVASCASALHVGWNNATYKFEQYPLGPYPYIRHDLQYIPAYQWLRENSPDDALVLVDPGADLAALQAQNKIGEYWNQVFMTQDDLFQIVARRRNLFNNRLFTVALSNEDHQACGTVFMATFGMDVEPEIYFPYLKRVTPDYIFWRKTAPVPRGYGKKLRGFCTPVYTDAVCEIWKVNHSALKPALDMLDNKE